MFDYQIDLDRAYAIRAEMVTFINSECAGHVVPETAVVEEIVTRHPDVPRDRAEHLAERIFTCWGIPGLDYEEAPHVAGYEHLRAWYPVSRDGRLQRVPILDLTAADRDDITVGLREQAELARVQADQLAATLAARRAARLA